MKIRLRVFEVGTDPERSVEVITGMADVARLEKILGMPAPQFEESATNSFALAHVCVLRLHRIGAITFEVPADFEDFLDRYEIEKLGEVEGVDPTVLAPSTG